MNSTNKAIPCFLYDRRAVRSESKMHEMRSELIVTTLLMLLSMDLLVSVGPWIGSRVAGIAEAAIMFIMLLRIWRYYRNTRRIERARPSLVNSPWKSISFDLAPLFVVGNTAIREAQVSSERGIFGPEVFAVPTAVIATPDMHRLPPIVGAMLLPIVVACPYLFIKAYGPPLSLVGCVISVALLMSAAFWSPRYVRFSPGRIELLTCHAWSQKLRIIKDISLRSVTVVVDTESHVLLVISGDWSTVHLDMSFKYASGRRALAKAAIWAARCYGNTNTVPAGHLVG